MTDKNKAQQAFKEVEKELEDTQIKELKKIVKATLEQLEKKKEKKVKIDKEIKILKSDIDDLKEGRLDRIKERQTKDPDAKKVSVIIIKEKVIEREVPVWRQPYTWYWNTNYNNNLVFIEQDNAASTGSTLTLDNGTYTSTDLNCYTTLNCNSSIAYGKNTNQVGAINTIAVHSLASNVAKNNTKGTYKLDGKDIVYLR